VQRGLLTDLYAVSYTATVDYSHISQQPEKQFSSSVHVRIALTQGTVAL